MRESDPRKSEPMYSLDCLGLSGLGPPGFAFDSPPLPFATTIVPLEARTRTDVGYHPVGINPRERAMPGRLTSMTAR